MKYLLKYLSSIIFAILLALLILFGSAYIYEGYYMRLYSNKDILYITNSSYMYLVLFIIFFTVIMIKSFFPNLFIAQSIEQSAEVDNLALGKAMKHFNQFIKKHKGSILLSGIIFIIIAFYISIQSYAIFYHDHFVVFRLFQGEKTYTLENVESFTIEIAGLFNRQGYSMKLYMEDGEDVELFGHIEVTTDAFEEKYSTYGYKVDINNQLLHLGTKKNIKDKALILKECENYDEPYRSDVRALVGE